MKILNVEIKAKSKDLDQIREILQYQEADFKGFDNQIDMYFKVNNGRLKLRTGNIENNLIHYIRNNQNGPKQSDVTLFKSNPDSALKQILSEALGVLTVVDKKRAIYFIDNVKFHLDEVEKLGSFVEIEAIDKNGVIGVKKLKEQCDHFMQLLGIQNEDLISVSYSDMMLNS